jgi:oxygen-independent coproporphyrinogen-3 oxidase
MEHVMTGIRLREGLPAGQFDASVVATLVEDGLLVRVAAADGGRVVLTRDGRLLANQVIGRLLQD